MSERLRRTFPGLQTTVFHVTSASDAGYNCIAWAAGDTSDWWWPLSDTRKTFWPAGAPREVTLDAFMAAFRCVGYTEISDETLEPGWDKVAIFVSAAGAPTHAARQRPTGQWTSKLGRAEDIEHELRALEGDLYGTVTLILKRPAPSS